MASASVVGKVVLGCGQLVAHSVQESGKAGPERWLLAIISTFSLDLFENAGGGR